MNSRYAYYAPQKFNMKKLYIVTRPTPRADLQLDELNDDDDFDSAEWREKARRLQIRRWRKLKHQLV